MSFAHPSATYPTIPFVPLSALPTEPQDTLRFAPIPSTSDGYSPIALGCATFGWGVYAAPPSTDDEKMMPLRTVRLALQYGIRMFDTSPHYHPSEAVLGNAFEALRDEYPRESYKISSKCGRYSSDGFDYSPANIDASVRRSIALLKCDYLDTIYLHDVEFIANQPEVLLSANRPVEALTDESSAKAWGLGAEDKSTSLGEGDDKVINAFEALTKLKEEGLVRDIGISGYPLPTLLRLSRLLTARFPLSPPSAIISYAHSNLANNAFPSFLPFLLSSTTSASGMRLVTASPLAMGLLVPGGVPDWHPIRVDERNAGLVEATRQVGQLADREWSESGGMIDLALGFGMRGVPYPSGSAKETTMVPVVVGAKNLEEVHEAVRVWSEINLGGNGVQMARRERVEARAREIYVTSGWEDVAWASPQAGAVGL